MNEQLPAFKIKQGRRIYDIYNIVNSLSFALVTGNTITLYALLLDANTTIVGLLNAFMYLSFFAIPIGKVMVNRLTIMQTFGYAWLLRNISLIPILAVPYFMAAGLTQYALYCLLLAVGCFNIFRGAGMIANNPVIRILAPGKDRSSYIVRISITNNVAALMATLILAVLLWRDSSISTYHLVSIIGIILGFIASALLFKLPEPHGKKNTSTAAETAPRAAYRQFKKFSFLNHVRDAFTDKNFRRFVLTFFIISFGISMIRPFVIVYAKEVYCQPDSITTLLSVFSILGALVVGLLMRLVIDRLGAKPIYSIFAGMSAASLIPALFTPGLTGSGAVPILFLVLFAAFSNMGFVGQDTSAQAYFFSMVSEEALMDLSMLYYFILGITGGLGSILGGTLLDFLKQNGFSVVQSYQIFFTGIISIIAIGMLFQRRLQNLGSYRVFETLAVMLSPRDLRALNLLHKLDSNENLEKEQKILTELGEIGSSISSEQMLPFLQSPRVSIRLTALHALYVMDSIDERVQTVLLKELETGAFTTAPLAAKILGKAKAAQALEPLRAALSSTDYNLTGEAMLSLAYLKDESSQFKIGDMLYAAENPAILLKGIQAMEIFNTTASIPFILDMLRRSNLPPYIETEALLALATLMQIENEFYYSFEKYYNNTNPELLISELLEEAFDIRKTQDTALKDMLTHFVQSHYHGYDNTVVEWLLHFGQERMGVRASLLIAVALDLDLTTRRAFRFFLAFWTVCIFKTPSLLEV